MPLTDQELAQQWKSFDEGRRTSLLAKMTPEQKKRLRTALEAKPVAVAPKVETPGFYKRLMQGTSLPSNVEELKAMQPTTAEKLIGPPAIAARAAYNYVSNLGAEGKKAYEDAGVAFDAYKSGRVPFSTAAMAGAAADTEFLLRGVLSPLGTAPVYAFGEDISQKNYSGAAGDALAVLINALLLKGSLKPKAEVRANKIAYAADVPESMNAAKDVKAVLPDLDRAAGKSGAPNTVGELLTTVKEAKNQMNTESGLAMQTKIGGKTLADTPASPDRLVRSLRDKAKTYSDKTPLGKAMRQRLDNAATSFEKDWTFGELDQERMNAQQRLNSYYDKSSTKQYAASKTDAQVIIDKAVVDWVQEFVYPQMDVAAGKPNGYFANLKQRQSILIRLEQAADENAKALATRTAKVKGSPRFSTENVSAYGHPASTPGVSIHKLQNIVSRPNLEARANRAVSRAFRGRPTSQAAIWSLPVRQLLLLPQQEPEPPVKNRKEALDLIGNSQPSQ